MKNILNLKARIKIFSALFMVIPLLLCAECIWGIPDTINIFEGERLILRSSSPYTISKPAGFSGVLNEDGSVSDDESHELYATANTEGEYKSDIKLFGIIPVKSVSVNVSKPTELIVGGNTIGIKMFTEGLLCVGISDIAEKNGNIINLAQHFDIEPGDIILSANGKKLSTTEEFSDIVSNSHGTEIDISFIKHGRKISKKITPVLTTDGYKLGIWVRDSTAGIGTMTFIDPKTSTFGALGHPITDSDTGTMLPVSEGSILNASIYDIKKGTKGTPGELVGMFEPTENELGSVTQNTPHGIFGNINYYTSTSADILPIASKNEVQNGKAQILCNISGNEVEPFNIELQLSLFPSKNGYKNMIVKITDDKLLSLTGGIVQGMSGSPIIQNDKIVGAVTHVFVNDPTRGYGVFIENMLSESATTH